MMKAMLPVLCIITAFFILPASAADNDQFIVLTVTRGDSLVNICSRYLQNPGKWPEIGRVNRLKDNDRIMPGQRLKIPVWLLRGIPANGNAAYVSGQVQILPARQSRWQTLARNDPVPQGSMVRTGRNSGVEILFDDGTSILQRQDTLLGLEKSEYKGENHLVRRLKLAAGRMLTKVRSATGKVNRFEIRTPSATAVARGTDFRVSSGKIKETTSEVLEGAIEVKARGKVVPVREGEGIRVNQGDSPLNPRKLLSPPSPLQLSSTFNTSPVHLSFKGVEGAVAYRFQLSRDPDGKDLLQDRAYPVKEPATTGSLEDGKYFIHVSSIDDQGIEGPTSLPEEITIRVHPLPPFIQNPAEGARYKGNTLRYRWLKVADARRYQVQTATDRDFRDTTGDTEGTGDTEHVNRFEKFGAHFFRIRSVAADGYTGAWSDPVSFTIDPPPPSPEVGKPEREKGLFHIRWSNRGEKRTYHCQVSMDKEFNNLLVDTKPDKPELTMPAPEKPGVYHVRISTIDPDGCEGDFSPPQTFEIKRRWPYAAGALGIVGAILLILL